MSALAPGNTIAGYRIEQLELSIPGTSIYGSSQLALGRGVALYLADAPAGSTAAAAFLQTARRLAAFEHPNVLPVYEVGEADGRVFATGRSRPGRSLADVLAAQGPLAPARATALVAQVTSALEALEGAGVHGLVPAPSSVGAGPSSGAGSSVNAGSSGGAGSSVGAGSLTGAGSLIGAGSLVGVGPAWSACRSPSRSS